MPETIPEYSAEGAELDALAQLPPHSLELSRGMKGQYGWTIKVRADDHTDLAAMAGELDMYLRGKYLEGGGNGGE